MSVTVPQSGRPFEPVPPEPDDLLEQTSPAVFGSFAERRLFASLAAQWNRLCQTDPVDRGRGPTMNGPTMNGPFEEASLRYLVVHEPDLIAYTVYPVEPQWYADFRRLLPEAREVPEALARWLGRDNPAQAFDHGLAWPGAFAGGFDARIDPRTYPLRQAVMTTRIVLATLLMGEAGR